VGPVADRRALQASAIWAFARRASARPDLELLKQDAVSLVGEILECELGGISEVAADGAVEARLTAVDVQGRAVPVAACRTTLEPATSMAAYAMTRASAVVSQSLVAEKRFIDLLLREQGVATGLVVPLPVDDKPYGTIGVFCRAAHEFTEDDVRFAETIAHLLSSSIARSRAEEQFRLGKSLADAVLESIDEMVFTLDAEGRVMGLNRAARERTGYEGHDVRGRPFAAVFLRPPEVQAFQTVFHKACSGSVRFACDLLTKKQEAVFGDWQFQPVKLGGHSTCIVLTGREASAEQPLQPFSPNSTAPPPKDLRSSARRSYQYRQQIAPMYTAALPAKREFFEVECKDISAGGVSFYLEREPDFTALVVGLGRMPDLAYFTARVARVVQESLNGKVYYVVGCRFAGRVHL
jgi:GAF domain-containing protein